MKIVALILARGGSKGIPYKNIVPINNKPLLAYTINASQKSMIQETWVSTDDLQIKLIAQQYNASVIDRPAALATDTAKSDASLVHFANHNNFNVLVFIQPTSPLLSYQDINRGIEIFINSKYDSVFSVYKEHWVPRWTISGTPDNWDINNRPMRQEVEEKFVENGAFYITSKKALLKSQLRYSGKIGMVEMPINRSFQIDTEDDLKLIKELI